jgi:hypothetical protein
MSGWKPCLVALVLTAWFATSSEAQGIVPGGWAPQFGYQTFGVPGGGLVGYGLGYGYSPYGMGGYAPPVMAAPSPLLNIAPSFPQAVNGLDPLTGAIRQSTRRKARP